jgi:hypothetical protein
MSISVIIKGIDGVVVELGKIGKPLARTVINSLADIAYEKMREGAGRHSPRINGTGFLFKSLFRTEYFQEARVTVGHDENIAPHAIFVVRRTRPHEIKQKIGGPMLHWIGGVGGNKHVFRHRVWHPGYIGDPYDEVASQEAVRNFRRIVDEAMKGI